MSASILLSKVGLNVPHYVQRERSVMSWTSTLLTAATSRLRRDYRAILSDVDLQAVDGDRIALIGRNGAGKTTLLRLLAGSVQPTSGTVEIKGTRQALLNLGLGFNTEATVRENIFLRGTAMGLRQAAIRELVDPILEFAELSHVASHRLATLSSGQRMRLGFAVSTSVQTDIMLLDEWFGAGDAAFVARARARMTDRVDGSRIVVLASHNFKMLRQVCTTGVVVDEGRIAFRGPIEEAFEHYNRLYRASNVHPHHAGELLGDSAVAGKVSSTHDLKQQLREARRIIRAQKITISEQRESLHKAKQKARVFRRQLRAQQTNEPSSGLADASSVSGPSSGEEA